MTQLDFTGCEPIRTAERQERHDAFWGPLNEVRRTATRVACDFFAFADEVPVADIPRLVDERPAQEHGLLHRTVRRLLRTVRRVSGEAPRRGGEEGRSQAERGS